MNLLAADFGQKFFNNPNHFLTRVSGLGTLVSIFLSNSIIIAGIILLFIVIIAGISIIGAGGNPQKLQAAFKLVTYGVGGFLLVFATYFIIRIVEAMTGVDILQ